MWYTVLYANKREKNLCVTKKTDIIELQEIREAIRFGGKNPYGNALISRYPIISAETILILDPEVKEYDGYYEIRCLLKATIDVGGELNVLVNHFGLNLDEQTNAVNTVVAHICPERCVLMCNLKVKI